MRRPRRLGCLGGIDRCPVEPCGDRGHTPSLGAA
jgi:hypothetical protein